MINILSLVLIFLLSSPSEGVESGDLLETLERLSQRVEVLEEEGRLKDERIVTLEAGQVHLYECAWQNQWGFNYDTARDDVVKFDNLFFQESSITNTTSLDIRSGVFTCKVPRGLSGHLLPQRPRQHRAHQQLHQPLQERQHDRGVLPLLKLRRGQLQLGLRDVGQDDVRQAGPGRSGLPLL